MTKLLTAAIEYAAEAHEGQVRKITGVPYIVHPMEACAIAATITGDEEVLAAAVLHDVIEDTDSTLEELEQKFGQRVADFVAAESENRVDHENAQDTWAVRKQATVDFLMNRANREEKIITLGDKLANMRAIYRDYTRLGEGIWGNFHEHDPQKHYWYYNSIAEALESELGETPAWKELNYLIGKVWSKD